MGTITWGGYTWNTGTQPAPPAVAAPPDPNLPYYNSNMWQAQNVSVQSNCLQLTLARNSGYIWDSNTNSLQPSSGPDQIWAAAQAVLQLPSGTQLTYGDYLVTVKAGTAASGGQSDWAPFTGSNTASGANTSTIFGTFLFDPQAAPPYNEMDIVEIGYQNQNQSGAWINQQPGGPVPNDAQFVLQPWDSGTPGQANWNYVHRINLDYNSIPAGGEITFVLRWLQGQPLQFFAAYGTYTDSTFPFTGPNTITWQTPASVQGSIPSPTPTLTLYLNLWPYGGPSTNAPVNFAVTAVTIPTTT
ncbi:MAG: hypothetical protein JST22_20910 [Bacteroidetes bacterium]|nr:hypothetical protein [Bacteroidota bacterium]